jgi:hypothetical protein
MSSPHEASLTEKERAILANLAAQAEADDPSLAATLRGRSRRAVAVVPRFRTHVRVPDAVSHWGWGLALGVVGLAIMLASISISLVLGIVGAVLTFAGAYRAATARPSRVAPGDLQKPTPATSDN